MHQLSSWSSFSCLQQFFLLCGLLLSILQHCDALEVVAPSSAASVGNVWGTFGGNSFRTGYAPVTMGSINESGIIRIENECIGAAYTTEHLVFCLGFGVVVTMNNTFNAYFLANGTLAWSLSFALASQQISPFYETGTDLVILPTRTSDGHSGVTAINTTTGAIAWDYPYIELDSLDVQCSLLAHSGKVFVAGKCDNRYCVVALNISNGWVVMKNIALESRLPCQRSLAVFNGVPQILTSTSIFANSSLLVTSLSAETGYPLWSFSMEGYKFDEYLVQASDNIFVTSGKRLNGLSRALFGMKVSPSNNVSVLWINQFVGDDALPVLAVANKMVYTMPDTSSIVGFDVTTGTLMHSYALGFTTETVFGFIATNNEVFLTSQQYLVWVDVVHGQVNSYECGDGRLDLVHGMAIAARDHLAVAVTNEYITIIPFLPAIL